MINRYGVDDWSLRDGGVDEREPFIAVLADEQIDDQAGSPARAAMSMP